MIRRFGVLMAVLLGVFFSSFGHAAETILIQGKVTNQFPECRYSQPSVFPALPPALGDADQGFVFLPGQLVVPAQFLNGKEGVYASWYTTSDPRDPKDLNFVAGIWPLSAITVIQNSPQGVELQFQFEVNGNDPRYKPISIVYTAGTPTVLKGTCTRASKGAPNLSSYFSDVVHGSNSVELFFPAPFPPGYINQFSTISGSSTTTSAFVHFDQINDLKDLGVAGLVQTFSGKRTILVKLIQ
jgi:hypothetical protein